MTNSKCVPWILQLEKWNEKPKIEHDLTGLLVNYLAEIEESANRETRRLLTINFAEAALFLQAAADLYCKKVDLLSKYIFKQRERELEFRKKHMLNKPPVNLLPDNVDELRAVITPGKQRQKKCDVSVVPLQLRQDLEKKESPLLTQWKTLMKSVRKYLENIVDILDGDHLKADVFQTFQQVTAVYDALRLEVSTMYDRDKPYEDLYPYSPTDYVVYADDKFEFTSSKMAETMSEDIHDFFHWYEICCQYVDPLDLELPSEAWHIPMVGSTTECSSSVTPCFEGTVEVECTETMCEETLSEKTKRLCPRRSSILITRLCDDTLQKYLMEPNDNSGQADVEERLSIGGVTEIDSGFSDYFCNTPPNMITIGSPQAHSTPKSVKRKIEFCCEPIRKKSRRIIVRPEPILTVTNTILEAFLIANYEPSFRECGQYTNTVLELDETVPKVAISINDTDDSGWSAASTNGMQSNNGELRIMQNQSYCLMRTTESINALEEFNSLSAEFEYNEWHTFVSQRIGTQEDASYDIHAYGTDILNHVQEGGGKIFANTIFEGQESHQVVRLFQSALQLANCGNMRMVNYCPGELANDTLQFEFVTAVRHHEVLQSYKAPSTLDRQNVELNSKKRIAQESIETESTKRPC